MSNTDTSAEAVEQSLLELQDIVRCRCHPAYTGRGLRDPGCDCDSAEAVKSVVERIEELEWFLGLADDQRREWERHCKTAEAERDEALNQLDSARHSVEVLEKRVKTFCEGWGVADKGRVEAETKLAKALAFTSGVIRHAGNSGDDYLAGVARATIAKLKGTTDE